MQSLIRPLPRHPWHRSSEKEDGPDRKPGWRMETGVDETGSKDKIRQIDRMNP
jgi:hypothetical protein